MPCIKLTSGIIILFLSIGCSTSKVQGSPLSNSTPEVTPTAMPTDNSSPVTPKFQLQPARPCPGEEINLKLVSSGFARGQLPIVLFPAPQSQPVDFETPGGNKYPPPQDSSTALLGELPVSPLGTGELRFSLQNSYTTRGGQAFEIHGGQRYLLYWQARPDAFTYIADIMPQNCLGES